MLLEGSGGLERGEKVKLVIFGQFDEPVVVTKYGFSLGVDTREDSFISIVDRDLELNQRGRREVILRTAVEFVFDSHSAIIRTVSDIEVDEMVVRVVAVQETEFFVFVDFPFLG